MNTIEGKFVNLVPLDETHDELTFKWRNSNRAKLLNGVAPSVSAQKDWILSRPSSELNYIIQLKSGTEVGMISLVNIDKKNKNAESARFLIGDEEAVKGIPAAVESMKLLYDLAFLTLELERVYGTIASKNKLMIKWQKYMGMTEEGRLRSHYLIDDQFQDAVCMGILKEEYYTLAEKRFNSLLR